MSEHVHRIRQELSKAGMTSYGFMKLETSYVPKIVHVNEHIKGVVYGRLEDTLDSVMLIATDQRVLFIDCKPFLKNYDEITYEVVAGIKMTEIGPFAGVVLHTRVKDYSVRFVNRKCAEKFVEYIESHIEKGILHHKSENTLNPENTAKPKEKKYQPYRINRQDNRETMLAMTDFPNTAVISTVDSKGAVHGSVVHYLVDADENYYVVTKSSTNKAQNILGNKNVALTIHRTDSLVYLQVRGKASIVTDSETANLAIHQITAPKDYTEGNKLPPVTKNPEGVYMVIKIVPTETHLHDYGKSDW